MRFFSKMKTHFSPTSGSVEELNLFNVFKPFYLVLSLCGMFPYSVKYNNTKHVFTRIPTSFYFNILWTSTVIFTISVFFVAHVVQIVALLEILTMSQKLSNINYGVSLAALNIVCASVFICTFINRSQYVKILNAIAAVLVQLSEEKSASILGSLRFQINIVVMGSIGFLTILQLSVNFARSDSVWKMLLVSVTFNVPQTIQALCLGFHYILIMVLVYILASIDENLQTLLREQRMATANYVIVKEKSTVSLRKMELIYARVYEIKRDVTAAFQAPILFSILQCFHMIISEAYIIYHAIVVSTYSDHLIVNCSVWIAYQFMKIYSLARCGSQLKEKAMKLAQTLHNIPTNQQDIKMLLEVQHFSSMINWQNIVVTVYGYFPLDSTLMSGMIATSTMYIIILVQFDKSSDEPRGCASG